MQGKEMLFRFLMWGGDRPSRFFYWIVHCKVIQRRLDFMCYFAKSFTWPHFPSQCNLLTASRTMFACSTGLPDGHHNQRQHQLLPHVEEDVPSPSRHDGLESCCSSWSRGLCPTVQLCLSQCITAHVRLPDTLRRPTNESTLETSDFCRFWDRVIMHAHKRKREC